MKILIVKLGSIGDIVHALPALAAMRQALPDAEISWVAENRSAEILRGNRLIDELIEVDTRSLREGSIVADILPRFREQFRSIRRRRFDIALDLQGLIKSAVIARLSGAKTRYGFARPALREPASRFLLTHEIEVPKQIHVVRKNLRLVSEALQIPVPDENFHFPIFSGPEHVGEAAVLAGRAGGEFALLNPAGGWDTKLWPAENFGVLADILWEKHGLNSIIATGPQETALAEKSAAASRSGRLMTAQPSLKGFFELAKLARVYVGGDTGPTHLAVAAGAPVVGIFGPTEWWRNGSTSPADICVERLDIGCRVDCHRRSCSNWICMDIGIETVADAVARRLGDTFSVIPHPKAGRTQFR